MALKKGWQLLDSKGSDDDKCGKRLLPQRTAKLESNLTGVDYITSFYLYKNWRMHTTSWGRPLMVLFRNVPGHNRTKIEPIWFFTNFGSTMSKYTVGIRKNRKKSLKTHSWIMVKLTSWVRPKDVPLQMRPLALHIGPYR